MNRKLAPFIDVVRLEDKETKLKSFVCGLVEQSQVRCNAGSSDEPVLLIARSIESPVAKAVAALVRDGTITRPLHVILALVPSQSGEGEGVVAGETISILEGAAGGRVVRDARLLDAHEQLVLSPSSSWIGDCMRRDPMKRDAYECYAADCSKTARWARISFERLWETCEAMPEEMLLSVRAATPEVCLPAVAAEDVSADPLRTSST